MSSDRVQRYAEAMFGEGVALDGEGPYDEMVRGAMSAADAEQAELRQALWDTWAALGHDTDGDTGPGAWIAGSGIENFARTVVADATEYRRECEGEMERQYAEAQSAEAKVAQMMRDECKGCGVAIHLADDAEQGLRTVLVTRPCSGVNTNVCVAEGCYGEACVKGSGE